MRTARPLILGSALALCALAFSPQGAGAQTLEDVIASVLADGPIALAEEARIDAAAADVRIARAAGLPQISAGAAYEVGTGDYDPGPNGRALLGMLPSGPEDSLTLGGQNSDGRFSATAGVEQPIFTGLRILNGIRQAKAGRGVAEARAMLVRQRTALQVADAYTAVIASRARLAAAEAAADSFGAEAEAARIRFETGRITRTDLALADAQAAAGRGALLAATAERSAAEAALVRLAGALPDAMTPPALPALPETPDDAVAAALKHAPAVLIAERASTAAAAGLRVARGARAPQVSARAAATYAEDQFVTGDEVTSLTLTAQVRVPIFEGGRIGAAIDRARADARMARFALDDARAAAKADALSAFARYSAAVLADEAAALRMGAADLAARGASLERELGQRSLQDTLAALALAADARASRAEAARALVLAAYGLSAAIGDPALSGP